MGSKVVVLLGLSLAVFLMIASEVTARELAETTTNSVDPPKAEKAEVVDGRSGYNKHGLDGRGGYNKHGDGYGHGGGSSYGGHGHGGHGGGSSGGHGGHGGGGGCKYGCCGHGYHGGCKCCSYKGEAVDATKP